MSDIMWSEPSIIEERYKHIYNTKQNALSILRSLQIAIIAQTVPFANYFQLGGLGNALRERKKKKKSTRIWKQRMLWGSENKEKELSSWVEERH